MQGLPALLHTLSLTFTSNAQWGPSLPIAHSVSLDFATLNIECRRLACDAEHSEKDVSSRRVHGK